MEEKQTKIKCRGIIIHQGKLLVLRHSKEATFFAIPGGELEY